MKKNIVFLIIVLILALGFTNCKSNKVSCPAYGDGGGAPGAIPKSTKTRSSVIPGQGPNGKRVPTY